MDAPPHHHASAFSLRSFNENASLMGSAQIELHHAVRLKILQTGVSPHLVLPLDDDDGH